MADFIDPLGALSGGSAAGGAAAMTPAAAPVSHSGSRSAAAAAAPASAVTVVLPTAAAFDPLSGAAVGGAGTSSSGGAVASAGGSAGGYGIVSVTASAGGAAASSSATGSGGRSKHSPYLDWALRKSSILKEFTVTGNIAVSASFMSDAADDTAGEETSLPLAKARQRLEQLEAAARGVATVEMSQAEYVRRIERLHRALTNAWDSNHRVAALKICIQVRRRAARHGTLQAAAAGVMETAEVTWGW